MKTLSIATALILLTCGCAKMGTRQLDECNTIRYEITPSGETNAIVSETRKTSTQASGTALFAAETALEGFKARQDGADQGLEISKTSQKSDSLRDAVELMKLGTQIGGMMYGIPPTQAPLSPIAAPAAPQPKPGVILQTPPEGQKWILAPIDNPSIPQPEQE